MNKPLNLEFITSTNLGQRLEPNSPEFAAWNFSLSPAHLLVHTESETMGPTDILFVTDPLAHSVTAMFYFRRIPSVSGMIDIPPAKVTITSKDPWIQRDFWDMNASWSYITSKDPWIQRYFWDMNTPWSYIIQYGARYSRFRNQLAKNKTAFRPRRIYSKGFQNPYEAYTDAVNLIF